MELGRIIDDNEFRHAVARPAVPDPRSLTLNDADPFDYLNPLQRHAEALKQMPSEWMPWNILFNTTIATAIADRLVENSEIFLLGGDSLRKANKIPDPSAE